MSVYVDIIKVKLINTPKSLLTSNEKIIIYQIHVRKYEVSELI